MSSSELDFPVRPAGAAEVRYGALSIGPAAALALARPGAALSVHSVFPSTLNLEVQGSDLLVALSGPAGTIFPHAVALDRPGDFRGWKLPAGSCGRVGCGAIHLEGPAGTVAIDLTRAARPPLQGFPRIGRLDEAYDACLLRLAELQAGLGCELRLGPRLAASTRTPLGTRLRRSARRLGKAARAACAVDSRTSPWGGYAFSPMKKAVTSLVGLGPGLTPSGDDFLCGFMAAACARGREPLRGGRHILDVLHEAVADNLGSTGDVSASLLRAAMKNCWPAPLVDLAQALAADRGPDALAALEALGRLGHSSGADIAAGFLHGLDVLAAEPRASPGEHGGIKERSTHGTWPHLPTPHPTGPSRAPQRSLI